MHGHLAARLDPLGSPPRGDPALDPETVNLSPELMARIPASVLRVAVPGETFADALPHLHETYCGTIAYEIEHISGHNRRVWLRQAIESGEHRKPLDAEEKRALLGAPVGGRGARGLPAQGVPRQEAVLDRGPRRAGADARRGDRAVGRQRRARGGAGHGPPRPAERAGPHGRAPVRVDPRRVRGRADPVGRHRRARGRHRRREVPLRRVGQLRDQGRQGRDGHAVAQPEPPRVREPGDRGPRARRPDQPQGPRDHPGHEPRGAGADPRRRRLPGPGDRGRDAQPPGAAGLLHRRHGPHHRQQPARLHHRPARQPLHPLRVGPGQGLRHPDHPRERRRRGGVHPRGAAGDGLPQRVRPRRPDRPDRLPPLRPQRDRRAGLHPAGDVRADQEAPAGARGLRGEARRARAWCPPRTPRSWPTTPTPRSPTPTRTSRRRSPGRPTPASTSSTAR